MIEKIDELLQLYFYYELGSPDPSELEFDFRLPSKEWCQALNQDTISIYLLDIDENRQLRKNEWQRSYEFDEIKSFKPPMMMDLYYLIIPFDKEKKSEREHALLSDIIKAIYRFESVTKGGYGLTPELEELIEKISIEIFPKSYIDDRLGLQLWNAIDQDARPVILLKVTTPVELAIERIGVPVKSKNISIEPLNEKLYAIIGQVVYKENSMTMPVSSAEVRLKQGSSIIQSVVCDKRGGFMMFRVPAGSFVIEVSANGYLDLTMEIESIPEAAKKTLIVEMSKP